MFRKSDDEIRKGLRDLFKKTDEIDRPAAIANYKAIRSMISKNELNKFVDNYSHFLYMLIKVPLKDCSNYFLAGQLLQALLQQQFLGNAIPLQDFLLKNQNMDQLKNAILERIKDLNSMLKNNKELANNVISLCSVFLLGKDTAGTFSSCLMSFDSLLEMCNLKSAEERGKFLKMFDEEMFKLVPELNEAASEQKKVSTSGSFFSATPDKKADLVKPNKKLMLSALKLLCDNFSDQQIDELTIGLLKKANNNLDAIRELTKVLIDAQRNQPDFAVVSKICGVVNDIEAEEFFRPFQAAFDSLIRTQS